ncbi:hypothetical protein JCM9492_04630 [Aquifex pyrophilus]
MPIPLEKPLQEHLTKDIEHKFHLFSTTVYQSSNLGGGAYNANHLVFELNSSKIKLFTNLSLSFGNGINDLFEEKGFSSLPSADDLERQTKNVNGSGRKYLFEAGVGYKEKNLELVTGLIDTTGTFDTSNYANDELSQFMNTDLVNNPLSLLPSYNLGMILNLNYKAFKFSFGVSEGKPDTESVYLLQGEVNGKALHLSLHYFYAPHENISGVGITGDYTLKTLGFFFRLGKNSEDNYEYFISSGLVYFFGKQEIGLGGAFRKGDKEKSVSVCEIYYKYELPFSSHITFDLQYVDDIRNAYVMGVRFHYEF